MILNISCPFIYCYQVKNLEKKSNRGVFRQYTNTDDILSNGGPNGRGL